MAATEEKVEFWGIIELFGHNRIAGFVSEATIGGCSFVRVDVPESNGRPAFTKYYGNGAIYAMTPVSEEIARGAVNALRSRPVEIYGLLPEPAPASSRQPDEDDQDEGDDYDEDDLDEDDDGDQPG